MARSALPTLPSLRISYTDRTADFLYGSNRQFFRMVSLEEGAFQPLPVLGVRNADQRLRPLLQVFPEQIDFSIFGNHPMDMPTRRDDARSFMQKRYDPRDARRSHARQGDDRHAPLGQGRSV